MGKLSVESVREIQLEILDQVKVFCELEGIEYYLAYGTLIGAIRHKGYIPWDDDIDIAIRRDQYEVFLSKFNKLNSHYKVYSCCNTSWFPYAFAKVSDESTKLIEQNDEMKESIGINIDIFPLDDLPLYKSKLLAIRLLTKILVLKSIKVNNKRTLFKNIVLIVGKLITKMVSSNWIARKINNIATSNNGKGQYLGNIVYTDSVYDYTDKTGFEKSTLVQFEDRFYNIPNGYDSWLRNYYGNYMQLPPVEKRVTHHDYVAYKN